MSRRRVAAGAGLVITVAAVVVVVVVVGATGGGGASRPSPTVPGARGPLQQGVASVGVNVNYVFNTLSYTSAQQVAILRTLARTGVDIARSDALWETTEPSRGVFSPAFDDDIVATLAAAGLRWQPIVDYAPGWARLHPALLHSPPADPATYATFAAWLARRYGPGGTFWAAHPSLTPHPVTTYELWNEPDVPLFWNPQPNAGAYAQLYLAAHAAIHAVDPHAVVLVGGLTNAPATLPSLLTAAPALRGGIDGVAIHPYGSATAASVLSAVRSARTTLDSLGLGLVPLYVTEFGWVTSPPGANHYVPAPARAALIRDTVDALGHTDCGLAGEVLYTWITPQHDTQDPEQWYGIEPVADALHGVLGADASAFRGAVAAARASGPWLHLCG